MTSQFDEKNAATKRKQIPPDSESASTCGPQPSVSNEDDSRRKFLQIVRGSVAGLVTAAGIEFVAPSSALAQASGPPEKALDTPEKALKELLAGNQRFVDLKLTSFDQDLAILRNHTSEFQQPFAAVLACADSRVPVELIFDQTIGHIFVNRVAGNVVTSEIIGSLEYGAYKLKTKVILVMGHGSCGAVEATIDHINAPGQISALYPHIQPAVDQGGRDPDQVSKVNARIQAALLRESSTVISSLVATGKLMVRAAFYDLASGVVSLLD